MRVISEVDALVRDTPGGSLYFTDLMRFLKVSLDSKKKNNINSDNK